MKKLWAVLTALMMLMTTMPAFAATQATITVQTDPDALTAVLGEETANKFAGFDGLSAVIIETDSGMSYTISRNGEFLYDFAMELDGTDLYLNSSLLDKPLYLDLYALAGSIDEAGLVLLTDWNGLLNELSALPFDFSGTLAAISRFTVSEDGTTVTADPEQLCAVVDALTADLTATQGLAEVANRYLGIEDLPGALQDTAAAADAWIRANVSGNLRIEKRGNGISVNLPVKNNVYGITVAANRTGLSVLLVAVSSGGTGYGLSISQTMDNVITLDVLQIAGGQYKTVLTFVSTDNSLTISSGERVLATETLETTEIAFDGELIANKDEAVDFLQMDGMACIQMLLNANNRLRELMLQ